MSKKTLEIRDKTIFDGVFVKYVLKFLFTLWFKIAGWKVTKVAPEGAGITIAAPHTSNWDFFYALGAAIMLDVKIYFSIKETWCRMPVIGSFAMWLGAIPIDRSSGGQGQVIKIKNFIKSHQNSRIFFLFTPEGTRGKVDKWKSGFYHIAQQCDLPIFLAKVDYRIKQSGVFHTYQITHDKKDDIAAMQASYKNIQGKFPADQFPNYSGPMPKISEVEANILRALYTLKGVAASKGEMARAVATRVDIAGKAKMAEISKTMLDFLIQKGVVEQVDATSFAHSAEQQERYQLTFAGKGCLLHLYPTLA